MREMKVIGLIGGMSWESTALYYSIVNREVGKRRGKLHSAPLHLISLDFEDIAARQRDDDWRGMGEIMVRAARRLEQGGAHCVLIGTNTMHRLAPEVTAAINVPLLHIADAAAQAIVQAGLRRVGLLGTRFTMEHPFYAAHLAGFGIGCVTPPLEQRETVHRIIFEELCRGHLRDESRNALRHICEDLAQRGAEGIVLGCTELPLILHAEDVSVPIFDTTALHAMAAVEFALPMEIHGVAAGPAQVGPPLPVRPELPTRLP